MSLDLDCGGSALRVSMVQVQSTWFPAYDRSPQTWVPNIVKGKASDFKAQTHRVWHTAAHPSRVEVMVQR